MAENRDWRMVCWRITKYNPEFRNKRGDYLNHEWTSFYDIGKKFSGKEFTFPDYIVTENAYIETVISIMNKLLVKLTSPNGLYIEEFESPYF